MFVAAAVRLAGSPEHGALELGQINGFSIFAAPEDPGRRAIEIQRDYVIPQPEDLARRSRRKRSAHRRQHQQVVALIRPHERL